MCQYVGIRRNTEYFSRRLHIILHHFITLNQFYAETVNTKAGDELINMGYNFRAISKTETNHTETIIINAKAVASEKKATTTRRKAAKKAEEFSCCLGTIFSFSIRLFLSLTRSISLFFRLLSAVFCYPIVVYNWQGISKAVNSTKGILCALRNAV